MDDIVLVGNSMDEIDIVKTTFDVEFKTKDLGKLKYFLCTKVTHSKIGINIYQRKYFFDLLKDTCLHGSKPIKTPIDPSIKLHQDTTKIFEDILSYLKT